MFAIKDGGIMFKFNERESFFKLTINHLIQTIANLLEIIKRKEFEREPKYRIEREFYGNDGNFYYTVLVLGTGKTFTRKPEFFLQEIDYLKGFNKLEALSITNRANYEKYIPKKKVSSILYEDNQIEFKDNNGNNYVYSIDFKMICLKPENKAELEKNVIYLFEEEQKIFCSAIAVDGTEFRNVIIKNKLWEEKIIAVIRGKESPSKELKAIILHEISKAGITLNMLNSNDLNALIENLSKKDAFKLGLFLGDKFN